MQLIYDKNGTGPQIKRNIRKFSGFEKDDRQTKLDQLKKSEEPAIKQTATILALEVAASDAKEKICETIIDFLIAPTGQTIEQYEKEHPNEDEDEPEEEEAEPDEESEEEEKPKKPAAKGRGSGGTAGRPKRAVMPKKLTDSECEHIMIEFMHLIKLKIVTFRLR